MRLLLDEYQSPLSAISVVTDESGTLRALEFGDLEARLHRQLRDHYRHYTLEHGAAPAAIHRALEGYFGGNLRALDDVELPTAGTEFQRAVWVAVRAIEPGTTKSYGQIAKEIGRANASRAVGAANGANPFPLVVPCHRVIGASGSLTGYGGGLPRKEWLLEFERRTASDQSELPLFALK